MLVSYKEVITFDLLQIKGMEQKLAILSQLINMARADKDLKDEEYELIWNMAKLLEVPQDVFDKLFEQEISTKIAASEFDRIVQFHRLVLLTNVDLEVDSRELNKLRDFGFKLGLRPEAITRVINEMKHYENGMIPPHTMLKIFQTYHN